MKKILTLVITVGLIITSFGQEAADKTILAGLTIGGALNFNDSRTESMEAKVGGDFMAGMLLDWNFSNNVGLTTGLEFEFDNFKTSYKIDGQPAVYYAYDDKEILRYKDDIPSNAGHFLLEDRKHSNIYVTLPVMLKFQTNFLGYFRYFGRFGVRNSFGLMTRTTDTGFEVNPAGNPIEQSASTKEKMSSKGLMNFYRGSIGITGGAEYNITGSTTLVAELGYFYGFTQMYRKGENARSLYHINSDNSYDYYASKLKQGLLMLKVSVLF